MSVDHEKYYIDANSEIDVNRLVLSTVISASFRIIVLGTLIFVLIINMFPLNSTRFFERLGLFDRALDMANTSVSRESKFNRSAFSKYADSLYYKMTLAEKLYHDGGKRDEKKYLKDIYDGTYAYSQINGIQERNKLIDENNLSSFLPFAHANVFSFSDRVNNLNYFAAIRLGKANEFFIKDKKLALSQIMLELEEFGSGDLLEQSDGNEELAFDIFDYCTFFGQVSEYIRFRLEQLSVDGDNGIFDKTINGTTGFRENDFFSLIDLLEDKMDILEDFALTYTDRFVGSEIAVDIYARQAQLYLVRNIGKFYDCIFDVISDNNIRLVEWTNMRLVNVTDGSGSSGQKTLTEFYYQTLLPGYTAFFDSL